MRFDFKRLKEDLRSLKPLRPVIFHPAEEDSSFASRFAEFLRGLEEEAGLEVEVRRGEVPGVTLKPCLTLQGGGGRNIHYLAVPEGPEGPPFVEALMGLAGSQPRLPDLEGLARPASFLIFIAPSCPHCPGAVRRANRLALASPLITTSIVDAQQFSGLARRFGARAVPLTVLDEGLSWTGIIPASELAGEVLSRGQEGQEARLFRSLIETSRFGEAARRIREGGGAAHLLAAWKESNTSSRMGLLLAAGEALDHQPAALDGIVADLLSLLRAEDAPLRGDTADLLGRIGHPAAREALRALRDDPHPDVAEIAAEALQEIESAGREGEPG